MGIEPLCIAVVERVKTYDPELRANWRNRAWWDAGEWRSILPEPEWHRWHTKFVTQAMSGYYFVEVMEMRALEDEGLAWQFEGMDFFRRPLRKATPGYEKIHSAFGDEKMGRLHRAAANYDLGQNLFPKTPDLFAFRTSGDRIEPVRFVEVKQDDRINERQLLGLALIERILGVPTEIVRYSHPSDVKAARPYRKCWPAAGFIPE